MPQATDSNLPSNRHTPIKHIPIHSTGYRQQSPKQPTHTDKKYTDAFHRLPTAIPQATGTHPYKIQPIQSTIILNRVGDPYTKPSGELTTYL